MRFTRKRPRSASTWTGVIVALAVLSAAGPSFAGPEVGNPAVDFTLPDHTGVDRSLSDYEGKVIVLAFITPS